MYEYVLYVNLDEQSLSWAFIPDDLWKNILGSFGRKIANFIAFDGIRTESELSKIEIFRSSQISVIKRCKVIYSFTNKLKQEMQVSYDLALFEYNLDVHNKITMVDFNQWQIYNDKYPVDDLFFFQDDQLFMHVTPHESTISFYLDAHQFEILKVSDKRISPNLYNLKERMTNYSVTVQWR